MVSLSAADSCVAYVVLGCFTAGSYCSERFFLLREILHLCETTFLGEVYYAHECSEGIWVVSPFQNCQLQILWFSNTSSSVKFKAINRFCLFTVLTFVPAIHNYIMHMK